MRTPRKEELTPTLAIKWLEEIRKVCEGKGNNGGTLYGIRYMFKYIERVMQYQVIMPPAVEGSGRFICPRCNQGMIAESGTVDDYAFCPLCGQKWRETDD